MIFFVHLHLFQLDSNFCTAQNSNDHQGASRCLPRGEKGSLQRDRARRAPSVVRQRGGLRLRGRGRKHRAHEDEALVDGHEFEPALFGMGS